jgi:Ca2+-binding RTX toxin-like protein
VRYSASAGGVQVQLFNGIFDFGDAAGDVLVGIENVVGSAFGDNLFGDAGANRLDGGRGDDLLNGEGGNDILIGSGGSDILNGGVGAELLSGGGGAGDSLRYLGSTLGVNVNLSNGQVSGGDAAGDTISGFEDLVGSTGGDVLAGTLGANVLSGIGGADRLFGLAGDDFIIGGNGADTMTGGDGADRFFYGNATNESPTGFFVRDVINDFSHAQGDLIDLGFVDANAGTAGDDVFQFLGKDGFLDAPGQIEYVFEGNNTVVRVNTAGDGAPEMEIQLTGQINLVAGDFFL